MLLITKGDLLDQERKLTESGLWEFFDGVEIVSEKTQKVYERIFAEHGEGADSALMVGNSMKSDVVPAIEAGAWGVHVPHSILPGRWRQAEPPNGNIHGYRVLNNLGNLPALLNEID